MRVLVTGANGLLGSHLVRQLERQGHEARALVRATSNVAALGDTSAQQVVGDTRNADAMRRAAEGCDLVFHTAALFSYWGYSRDEMFATAHTGTVNVLDAAKAAGARRVVLTSSVAVFGGSPSRELRDEHAPIVTEGPLDYIVMKSEQETHALAHAQKIGMPLVVANPCLFFGPDDPRGSAALAAVTGYLVDPLKMTYPGGVGLLHADDVALGHLTLAERGTPFERHILAGENLEWTQLHHLIAELTGAPTPRLTLNRPLAMVGTTLMELAARLTRTTPLGTRAMASEVGNFHWFDSTKTRQLGFAPRSARETVLDTLAWLWTSSHLPARVRRSLTPCNELQARIDARAASAMAPAA